MVRSLLVLGLLAGCASDPCPPLAFDEEAWRASAEDDCELRYRMARDLLRWRRLVGMECEEVAALLGREHGFIDCSGPNPTGRYEAFWDLGWCCQAPYEDVQELLVTLDPETLRVTHAHVTGLDEEGERVRT